MGVAMTIETVTCARCGGQVPLDVDHGEAELKTIHMDDRDERDDYSLCMDCTRRIKSEWNAPV